MTKPVWKGTLTFGLVSLPVALYPATESHTVRFHQLQRGTTDRVRQLRVNERTGEVVSFDDVVKGYPLAEGRYVVVEPAELEELSPGRSRTIEISGFADLAEIDPVFFDRTYHLGPADPAATKVYQLLVEALAHSHRAGIAVLSMRGREYLTAVDSAAGHLELHTLHWADELRDPQQEVPDLPARRKDFNRTELAAAEQLIDMLAVGWHPDDYHDGYGERVRALVEAKADGRTITPPAGTEPEATEEADLIDVLRRSLDEAARAKGGGAGAQRAAEDLASLSKAELYRRAAALGVPHRSTMTRDQLQYALKAAARPRRNLRRAS
ncbi:MAG: Ku protein [Kitasatospora sp.]|jgi:DNA end-binding protein Ku|nr:Ku protein [Kitasatospora sp.]